MLALKIKGLRALKDALRILLLFVAGAVFWIGSMFFIGFVFGFVPEIDQGQDYQMPDLYLWSAIAMGIAVPVYGFYRTALSNPEGTFFHMLVVAFILCWIYPIAFYASSIGLKETFFNVAYVYGCMLTAYGVSEFGSKFFKRS